MSSKLSPEEKSLKLSQAGRKGYLASLAKNPDFHQLGGEAYPTNIDGFFCECHGVGLEAALIHGRVKGKKHRYRGKN